ncbi:polyisoprenoid-binding protein [Virgisporangium aliadipatigenens]|uniref:Polyisoprenoid-binding protein n=1 Tax=Virgisporangium aliadipatigenens TaxID=741659 RepID=A0A8J4DSF9_9ACTN|nr:YceI family protein [Virgisporangium aliadipatigenens]GIJ47202.1 polyisoprenoid-binding protein [Virgisporangium aliadipatigenens]
MTAPTHVRDFNGLTIPAPGTYSIDPAHTEVGAVVRHLVVSKVRGSFHNVTGTITVAEDPLKSSVVAEIPAETINTRVADRDAHLRSADFLDVENHPKLTFASTGVVKSDGNEFVLRGDLTIRGVTREVELAVEFDGVTGTPYGTEMISFTASFEFDREDFGILWNQALETGGVMVSKKVKVEIDAQAIRQQ